ncbi:MAG: Trm112 family protein [Deltaproteobacteria bacterium]|nr:Trm112 family protein [Deltaproteobacteria bacterium]
MKLKEDLISILSCPKCKGKLIVNDAGDEIICEPCALVYPVRDGIPVMLVSEAKALT